MQRIDSVIRELELIRNRPGFYIHNKEGVDLIIALLNGFWYGCKVFEYNYGPNIQGQIYRAHGWQLQGTTIEAQMREKGMNEQDIVVNLIELEIEKWKLFEEQHESTNNHLD